MRSLASSCSTPRRTRHTASPRRSFPRSSGHAASAPIAARIGDALRRLRLVLVASTLLATVVTVGLLPTQGFWPLFALALLQAAMLAPVTVVADALALTHARPANQRTGFEYGWVR